MLDFPARYARGFPSGLISRCGRWSVHVARYARLPRSLRSRVSIRIDFSLELCATYAATMRLSIHNYATLFQLPCQQLRLYISAHISLANYSSNILALRNCY